MGRGKPAKDAILKVAILCAARTSVYHELDNLEVYDQERDARTFAGGLPVVAHPPCRAWSATCRQLAKPEPGEIELGLFCCEKLKECGGVLEQPAHSHLFDAGQLPKPLEKVSENGLFTLAVFQAWWGYPMKKSTWLCFSGIDPRAVELPLRLHNRGKDWRKQQLMSKRQRSETTREFAEWLIDIARTANP